MNNIEIYVDGACRGNGKLNESIGGWGVYSPQLNLELYGGEQNTTNNRMELTAGIEALRFISKQYKKDSYTIYTDSNYVKQGATEWLDGWVRKNYSGIKNPEMWKEIYDLMNRIGRDRIKWVWVKGHDGNVGNEKADELANKGCDTCDKKDSIFIKEKRFINAISNIYLLSEDECSKLFNKFYNMKSDEHNQNSIPNRIYLKIMETNS